MLYVGPSECQDGVTNNCSQDCTRRLINESLSYEYDCTCDEGYAANHFGYCEGKNLLMKALILRKPYFITQ